jgi:hypothetical protein
MGNIPNHSYAYKHNIHNHSDQYYEHLKKLKPGHDAEIDQRKTRERAAYQAYHSGQMAGKAADPSAAQARIAGGGGKSAPGLTTQAFETHRAAVPNAVMPAGQTTRDGYSVGQAAMDMTRLAQKNGIAVPQGAKLQALAQGIIDGVNANFTGKNGLGDFSGISGKDMGRTLIASAFQESKFNTQGQDGGGLFQVAPNRLAEYNAANSKSLSQNDLKNDVALAAKVGTWCIANPTSKPGYVMTEHQAGNVPIPSNAREKSWYFWNYHPEPGHGHPEGELTNYMNSCRNFYNQMQ